MKNAGSCRNLLIDVLLGIPLTVRDRELEGDQPNHYLQFIIGVKAEQSIKYLLCFSTHGISGMK